MKRVRKLLTLFQCILVCRRQNIRELHPFITLTHEKHLKNWFEPGSKLTESNKIGYLACSVLPMYWDLPKGQTNERDVYESQKG